MSIHKKNSKKVVKDMKECFKSFHLPVNSNTDLSQKGFTSEIKNDRACATVFVSHNEKSGYVRIQTMWYLIDPFERFTEAIKLLDLCNGVLPLHRYTGWSENKMVLFETALFLPNRKLPVGKFKRLLRDCLEQVYLVYPLIAEVMIGSDPKETHARFLDGCKALRENKKEISSEAVKKILSDMEPVLHELNMSILDEDRFEDGFYVNFDEKKQNDPLLRMVVKLFKDQHVVVVELFSRFVISDEKMAMVSQTINWINIRSEIGCMRIRPDSKQVIFRNGIVIENDILDKMEFRKTVENMTSGRNLIFNIIKMQLITDDSPDVILEKLMNRSSS